MSRYQPRQNNENTLQFLFKLSTFYNSICNLLTQIKAVQCCVGFVSDLMYIGGVLFYVYCVYISRHISTYTYTTDCRGLQCCLNTRVAVPAGSTFYIQIESPSQRRGLSLRAITRGDRGGSWNSDSYPPVELVKDDVYCIRINDIGVTRKLVSLYSVLTKTR